VSKGLHDLCLCLKGAYQSQVGEIAPEPTGLESFSFNI
jgi:hypothetical protein